MPFITPSGRSSSWRSKLLLTQSTGTVRSFPCIIRLCSRFVLVRWGALWLVVTIYRALRCYGRHLLRTFATWAAQARLRPILTGDSGNLENHVTRKAHNTTDVWRPHFKSTSIWSTCSNGVDNKALTILEFKKLTFLRRHRQFRPFHQPMNGVFMDEFFFICAQVKMVSAFYALTKASYVCVWITLHNLQNGLRFWSRGMRSMSCCVMTQGDVHIFLITRP